MAGFFMGEETQERMDLLLIRALVLLSFAAHLTMALLAGICRRRDSGLRRFLVWFAYYVYVTEIGTPMALGWVFLDPAAADSEQKMFALWAPFLLLHLGHPDNISSYAFMRDDGALRAAFFIMLFFGSYKYVERVVALHRASFANIRRKRGKGRDNDDVLLDAHGVLGVTMAALADYQVSSDGYRSSYSGWKEVSNVVEMEASLMYDILYSTPRQALSVIHTWGGYTIRVLSPLATVTALCLFHGEKGLALVNADRMTTYILLVALGSTWTYALLVDKQQDQEEEGKQVRPLLGRRTFWYNFNLPRWVKHACRRAGRQLWYFPRCLLVSLDPSRLSLRSGPSGHRLLSGSSVGQRNLLHECSTPQGTLEKVVSIFAGPGKKKIDVKDELLEAMCARPSPTREISDCMGYNQEHYSFESNLIALRVTTDIFLLRRPRSPGIEIQAISDYMMFLLTQRKHMVLKPGDEGSDYKKSLLDLKEIWRVTGTSGPPKTRARRLAKSLLYMDVTQGSTRKSSLLFNTNKTLALGADWALKLLHELDRYGSGRDPVSLGYRPEDFILVFTDEAQINIKRCRDSGKQLELLDYMLKLILDSWVRFLTFTSQECSRESHANQLSCGGELLTIVWLMKQHSALNLISKGE
ncbi:hypothetical protein VPH35_113152 [Triticum aestivum]